MDVTEEEDWEKSVEQEEEEDRSKVGWDAGKIRKQLVDNIVLCLVDRFSTNFIV